MSARGRRPNLELNLGKRCNNRCVFCLDARAPAEARRWVPLPRVRDELQRARRRGIDAVGLLGGEPTAHPSILTIVGEARSMGFTRVALSTNALRLADTAFADALIDAGASRFTISLHAHRADDEDALSGRPGNFARKLRALDHLVARHRAGALPDNVSLNPVLTTRLVDRLPAFLAFVRRRGVRDVRANLIRTDACPRQGPTLTPRLSQVTRAMPAAVVIAERIGVSLAFGDLPLCAYPWEVLADPRRAARTVGEARDLETYVSVFQAPDDPGRDASRFRWRERKRDALKQQPQQPCGDCRLADRCEGIWRAYLATHGAGDLSAARALPAPR